MKIKMSTLQAVKDAAPPSAETAQLMRVEVVSVKIPLSEVIHITWNALVAVALMSCVLGILYVLGAGALVAWCDKIPR